MNEMIRRRLGMYRMKSLYLLSFLRVKVYMLSTKDERIRAEEEVESEI